MKRQWLFKVTPFAVFVIAFAILTGFISQDESNAQDQPKIKPGNYEITTKMRSSLDNALSKKTLERCIQGDTINPKSFLPDPERCELTDLVKSGNKSSFDMKCTSPSGLILTGHMEYTVGETSFSYKFELEAPHEGKTLDIESEGHAKRIGECPPEAN